MGTDRLRSITVDAASVPQMTLAMIEIERVLRREQKIRPGGENDFQIRNQSDILATFEDTAKTFTYLMAGKNAVKRSRGGNRHTNITRHSEPDVPYHVSIHEKLGDTKKTH